MKYKQNLRVIDGKVYSYDTHVATIDGRRLLVHGHWSVTTSKHVNHVAATFGLQKVEQPNNPSSSNPSDGGSMLKSVAAIAKLGEIFCNTPKEKNDWQVRMLKAGLENRGLIMPDDWDSLSEEEKTKRLSKAIGALA